MRITFSQLLRDVLKPLGHAIGPSGEADKYKRKSEYHT